MSPSDAAPAQKPPRWKPDRKVWAGGLAAVLSSLILSALNNWLGLDLQPIVAAAWPIVGTPLSMILNVDPDKAPSAIALLSAVIGLGTAYLLPPSVRDIVTRIDNRMVKLANADPDNPTTAKVVAPTEAAMAARVDVATGMVPPPP